MPKRTFQPKKRHRAREHGFMKRMATKAGRAVLKRRRIKGRAKLSAWYNLRTWHILIQKDALRSHRT